VGEEPLSKGVKQRRQEREEEGIGAAFKGQLAFVEAQSHFGLPAASIGEDDAPGVLRRLDGLGGEQIPRLTAAAGTHHDQPSCVVSQRFVYRQGDYTHLALAMATSS
jgi:hypothetical protein